MAQKVTVELVDDLDGSTGKDISTVAFGWEGRSFEIDLSPKNRAKFEKAMQGFVEAARVIKTNSKPQARRRSESSGVDPAAVREWAAAQNPPVEVSARGRISAAVVAQYKAATGS